MSAGRCSGCGLTNTSCSVVRRHVMTCPDYIALFHSDPTKCLDPEDELVRFKREDDTEEARDAARSVRIGNIIAGESARKAEQVDRWKTVDLLDD